MDPLKANCNAVLRDTGGSKTAEGSAFDPNPWGFYQVHVNVWAWVQDRWHATLEGAPQDGSAWEVDGGKDARVLRDGSWYSKPEYLRTSCRLWAVSRARDYASGFRVARTLNPGADA